MTPARIIVADDSEAFRTALCDFLAGTPEIDVVAVAQDGGEALQLVQETHPDLLILDLQMPKVDGWEVLARLRAMNAQVRVLVLSSHSGVLFEDMALDRGASAYVAKGNIQRLLDTLLRLIAVFTLLIA